jgi:ubiquinone biosynthesis protein
MEGVGKTLYPEIDLVEAARPYVLKILEERYNPERLGKDLFEIALDSYQLFRTFPRRLDRILKMEEEGRRRQRLVLEGVEGALRNLTRGIQLTAFAILIFVLTYAGFALLPPEAFGSARTGMGFFLFFLAAISGTYILFRFRKG